MDRYQIFEDHRPESVTSWSYSEHPTTASSLFVFNLPHLVFQVGISANREALNFCKVLDANQSVPKRRLDPIRHEARQILYPVFDKGERVREFDLVVTILQAVERLAEFEDTLAQEEAVAKGWAAGSISNWKDVLANPNGLDVSSVKDTAFDFLGKTPEELVRDIPSSWRVIHIESILRRDLAERFRHYREELKYTLDRLDGDPAYQLRQCLPPHSKLEGRVRARLVRRDIIDDMIQPRVTFHGTALKNVASIVRYGFRLPGRLVNGKTVVSPRSGIAFDRGVYSSPDPTYALSYAAGQSEMTPIGQLPSMRLFVCATIMGRTFRGSNRPDQEIHGPLVDGYDSHYDRGLEYIIHDERAMLPCYVIHLDLGSEEAKRALEEAQRNPMKLYQSSRSKRAAQPRHVELTKGEQKQVRDARKAAAMKWFPYGFGPATGTNFVIEEIGEVSDDEEEYGDWQADKHAFSHEWIEEEEMKMYDDWDEEGNPVKRKRGLFMDQYQYAVR